MTQNIDDTSIDDRDEKDTDIVINDTAIDPGFCFSGEPQLIQPCIFFLTIHFEISLDFFYRKGAGFSHTFHPPSLKC